MHKTQLYLDEFRYRYLSDLAKKKKTSIAQIVRNLIDAHIEKRTKETDDPLSKVVGIGTGDGQAVAEHYEEYLYGRYEPHRLRGLTDTICR